MKIHESITINAAPEAVFALVTDLDREQEWDSGLISSEKLTDGPLGLGTRVKEVRKIPGGKAENVQEITRWEENRLMGWDTVEGKMITSGTISVRPVGDSSEVTFEMTGRGNLLMTLFSPVISWMVGREIHRNFGMLKNMAEANSPEAG